MTPLEFVELPITTGAALGLDLRDGLGRVPREACIREHILPIRCIIAIGRNYAEHAREQKAAVPERPLIFTKNPACAILHEAPIVIPDVCDEVDGGPLPANLYPQGSQVDYEGELAVIIGAPMRDVSEGEVLHAGGPVLGACCAHDVTARWWQKSGSGGQFVRGKSFDTFCPLGPRVVPLADMPPLDRLSIQTRLNGETVQRDTTANMMFPVAHLLAELSRGTTLLPGTAVLTGTPSGVGSARTPPRYLKVGDVVEIEVEGIGVLRNRVTRQG